MAQAFLRQSRPANGVIALLPQLREIQLQAKTGGLNRAMAELAAIQSLHPDLQRAHELLQSAATLDMSNEHVSAVASGIQAASQEKLDFASKVKRKWNPQRQAELEEIVGTPTGMLGAALANQVSMSLIEEGCNVLAQMCLHLEFWYRYRPFERVSPVRTPAEVAAVVDQIRRVPDDDSDNTAISMRDALFGRVLQAIADGRCTDPAQMATAALEADNLEFPREYTCHCDDE